MPLSQTHLRRLQVIAALRPFPAPGAAPAPGSGWLRAVREALGMTQSFVARRIGASQQAVQEFERAEAERRISLDSLDRVARGMGCRLVYAVVPEDGSLDELRERQATRLTDALLGPADHSMNLEAQGVSDSARERQRQLLIESLLQGSPRKLWK